MRLSSSVSERVLAACVGTALTIGGCRAFVDLDGLGDGVGASGADTSSGGGGDANIDGVGGGDASVDVFSDVEKIDVIVPDVDAGKACPNLGGPTPVRIPTATGGSYCIDSTEVTRDQYVAFLASNPVTTGQPAQCAWNTSFIPGGHEWPPAAADLTKPVGVNWCAADTFCKWAGKHLCGKIGGGVLTPGAAATTESQHMFACSSGGSRVYPYGNNYDPMICNGVDALAGLENVKARPGCEGGFAGLFDLAGNVHEWLDSCVITADPATDGCVIHNGAYDGHPQADMACSATTTIERNHQSSAVGIRCCSD